MCSIAGFYNSKDDFMTCRTYYEKILDDMQKKLYHRGPDEHNSVLQNHCGLSHTRLSIIDLTGGQQPMRQDLDGYSYHIVYNGEIYNQEQLKKELLSHDVIPKTTSDTELLLLSYLTFGIDFIEKVDGIFAIAIYDERHNTLTLYRDPFGVKPLFYTYHDGTLIFASELKGLFCYPGIHAVLDQKGLNELLSLGPAHSPGCGVLKGCYEVLPGTYRCISPYGEKETVYFRLKSEPHFDSYEETIAKVSFLVKDAIERQMVSDVPICTFLSGGVDSSVVSAVCAKALKKQGRQLTTYSFDFMENDKYFKANSFQPSQDRPYVEQMVEYLGSDHHYLECSNKMQADLLTASVDAHDLPCMADIDSSLLYFCKKVSRSHKVVLTGECADEVFGGYPWFHREEMLSAGTFPWTPSLEPRKQLLSKELISQLHMEDYVAEVYDKAVSEIPVLPEENETEANRRRIGYLNIRFFMQTLLNRMDRTSMYSGLEARVPFADKTLVQYVFNIPWEMKAQYGVVKNVLRQACKGLLPDGILFRKKSPYPKTYHPYYETLLSGRLKEVLAQGSPLCELLDEKEVEKFLALGKDYGSPWYGQLMAGPQMIAYLLQLDYFFKKYKVTISL